jgi:hypothetical protein
MSTQNTEPDFSEPWKCETGDFEIYSKSEHNATAYAESARIRDRIIKCVNACQGMADPAAEIEAMRAAITELKNIVNAKPSTWGEMSDQFQPWAQNRAKVALAKLAPFLP